MQQRRPGPNRTGRRHLEPYPAPSVEVPPAWPTSLPPVADSSAVNEQQSQASELEGVYIISVAARLLEMHPQTLRKYERLGLIQPVRTVGMLRLYSHDDLRKVMLIRHLMDNLGLNLAGVEFTLKLVNNLRVFSRRLARSTNDPATAERIREEVSLLCDSLSLPAPDQLSSTDETRNSQ